VLLVDLEKNIFEALAEDDYVLVYPEDGSLQRIPKEDFRIVYDVWEQYLAREVRRYEIRDKTRFSSHIISIIHFCLKKEKRQANRSDTRSYPFFKQNSLKARDYIRKRFYARAGPICYIFKGLIKFLMELHRLSFT